MKEPLNISINWKEKMQFVATNDMTDYEVAIDVPFVEEGGEKKGTTPKHLFLQSIAACTAQIIVMMLRKMKAKMPEKFNIQLTGNLTQEHPMVFDKIEITYHFEGETKAEQIKKAVHLSESKYCGLSYMVGKVATITSSIFLNKTHI